MKKLALKEAEEASKQAHQHAEVDAEKKVLLDRLRKPSGVSDEEAIQRAIKIIARGGERENRGSGAPFSQPTVHG